MGAVVGFWSHYHYEQMGYLGTRLFQAGCFSLSVLVTLFSGPVIFSSQDAIHRLLLTAGYNCPSQRQIINSIGFSSVFNSYGLRDVFNSCDFRNFFNTFLHTSTLDTGIKS